MFMCIELFKEKSVPDACQYQNLSSVNSIQTVLNHQDNIQSRQMINVNKKANMIICDQHIHTH